jgi:predicted SAM-dependent methyltransferase
MLSRTAKELYYMAAGPFMRISGAVYRLWRAPRSGKVRVHLGPGQERYLPEWINIDANVFTGKCEVWADLRHPLPLRDSTVTALYSHHVIEHLPKLEMHFAEAMRCLAPGGVYRVGGPNGDVAIAKFIEGDKTWFGDWPDNRRSIGGRFENFVFCRGEHVTILTFTYLSELLENAGFINVTRRLPIKDSGFPELFGDAMATEFENDFEAPHTLLIEAQKPLTPQ